MGNTAFCLFMFSGFLRVKNLFHKHTHISKNRRFVHKNGQPNVTRKGESRFDSFNIYHYLLQMPVWRFLLLILAYYTTINFLFAVFYFLFSQNHLKGLIYSTPFEKFEEAFFFSSQTLTTVGYGRISPVGLLTNAIAAFEALIGILTLAIITGTLYGRFVRPKAYVRFSYPALVDFSGDTPVLTFRLVASKKTRIHELKIRVSVALRDATTETGYRFFPLALSEDTFNALYLSWTVSHIITPESPLYGRSAADYEALGVELLVHLNAFDEQFSSNVIARTSYVSSEIVYGASFEPMYENTTEQTILYLDRLDRYQKQHRHLFFPDGQPASSGL